MDITLTGVVECEGVPAGVWPVLVHLALSPLAVVGLSLAAPRAAPPALLAAGCAADAMIRQGWPLDADPDAVALLPDLAADLLREARRVRDHARGVEGLHLLAGLHQALANPVRGVA
jgi:hypothetical protein